MRLHGLDGQISYKTLLFSEADIPVVGNVFSFVITKYPHDWRWRFLKVRGHVHFFFMASPTVRFNSIVETGQHAKIVYPDCRSPCGCWQSAVVWSSVKRWSMASFSAVSWDSKCFVLIRYLIDPNRTLDVGYFDFLLYFSLCLAGFLDGSVPDSHRFTVFILSRL